VQKVKQMKHTDIKTILLPFLFVALAFFSKAQPIPVEFVSGHRYVVFDVNLTKKFSPTSKWGFFHMNTIQAYYQEKEKNSFIIQDLLFFEALKNFRLAGGAFYGKPGFNPTIGFQYNPVGKKTVFLFAPRINLTSELSYDFMTIFQYKTPINSKLQFFGRFKMLNLFDANAHIKSYQWIRLGLEARKFQFGLAANIDEMGPEPIVESNFGVFVRKEIF
jgi:hypothetical protein